MKNMRRKGCRLLLIDIRKEDEGERVGKSGDKRE